LQKISSSYTLIELVQLFEIVVVSERETESRKQATLMVLLKSAGYGTTLWYLAALFIKKSELFQDTTPLSTQIVLYVVAAPTGILLVHGLKFIGIKKNDIPKAAVIATAVATLLDGVALIWLPSLYSNHTRFSMLSNSKGAAFLLWAVGWILLYSQA